MTKELGSSLYAKRYGTDHPIYEPGPEYSRCQNLSLRWSQEIGQEVKVYSTG
jgi:hypothetical protein